MDGKKSSTGASLIPPSSRWRVEVARVQHHRRRVRVSGAPRDTKLASVAFAVRHSHPQRVDCDLHDAFTDETMATRLRVLNRWALQSDDVRLSMWDFLQSVAGGMARFVDGSERCDVHRT